MTTSVHNKFIFVAVIKSGEDKYGNGPLVIAAETEARLRDKIGRFLLTHMTAEEMIRLLVKVLNIDEGDKRIDQDSIYEFVNFDEWRDFSGSDAATCCGVEVAKVFDLYEEYIVPNDEPWNVFHIHEQQVRLD